MENIKNRTEELLLSTGRQGIADLLVEMDEMGFIQRHAVHSTIWPALEDWLNTA